MGWPGLTQESVNKHFPESDETQKGHMKSQRQGVRSTQEKEESKNEKESTYQRSPRSATKMLPSRFGT